jgi:hypothetical protein
VAASKGVDYIKGEYRKIRRIKTGSAVVVI